MGKTDWKVYRGDGKHHARSLDKLPEAPPWRQFENRDTQRAQTFQPPDDVVEAVNAALYLRRPLLVTGDPGTGKSSLAYSVAHELGLGKVLAWHINSRSTLKEGLYQYDAVARMRDATADRESGPAGEKDVSIESLGRYITLGALGTAFASDGSRVVLIDEIDKSDIDLPNDLLHVLEDGEFEIPELLRIQKQHSDVDVDGQDGTQVRIRMGRVPCKAFPFIVITNNGERDLPPAFLRRCLRLSIKNPDEGELSEIVAAHLGPADAKRFEELIGDFHTRREQGRSMLSTDQLLNAVYLLGRDANMTQKDRDRVLEMLFKELTTT